MANFAELDQNNKVINVVVVGNDIPTSNGPLGENDMHPDGEAWCVQFFKGGIWKQTSWSGKFRKQLAGKDSTYDPINDIFIKPKPFESWSLDSNFDWKAPIIEPTIGPDNNVLNYFLSGKKIYKNGLILIVLIQNGYGMELLGNSNS
jgi:hypothetical protein